MGTEADFLDPHGAANPDLVARLSKLQGVEDPNLLAQLIDGLAGRDVDFNMFCVPSRVRARRVRLRKLAAALQNTAREFLDECPEASDVDLLTLVVTDIMKPSPDSASLADSAAPWKPVRLIEAIELVANFPFDLESGKGGRPPADDAILKVVCAVAEYCQVKMIPFTGAPRRTQADNKAHHFVKSPAAVIVAGVLKALGLEVANSKLATFMGRARELHPAL